MYSFLTVCVPPVAVETGNQSSRQGTSRPDGELVASGGGGVGGWGNRSAGFGEPARQVLGEPAGLQIMISNRANIFKDIWVTLRAIRELTNEF